MQELEHLVMKSRHAAHGGFGCLSTGEKLAVALILNRSDWLNSMSYTIAEAIERIGPEWMKFIPAAAKAVAEKEAVSGKKE
ncbi:hypothetical protein [Methylovorus mays]|uniref:hypothetical protein n=1 Tax=Methylovorus mays TaxID=184077 RepID=UPI001E5DA7A1|nr:hypothetical protein [Methylovorus mays]MCB5207712.1 hypothetical protein [Methylovorus mays]